VSLLPLVEACPRPPSIHPVCWQRLETYATFTEAKQEKDWINPWHTAYDYKSEDYLAKSDCRMVTSVASWTISFTELKTAGTNIRSLQDRWRWILSWSRRMSFWASVCRTTRPGPLLQELSQTLCISQQKLTDAYTACLFYRKDVWRSLPTWEISRPRCMSKYIWGAWVLEDIVIFVYAKDCVDASTDRIWERNLSPESAIINLCNT
jgi:hypothetical protein